MALEGEQACCCHQWSHVANTMPSTLWLKGITAVDFTQSMTLLGGLWPGAMGVTVFLFLLTSAYFSLGKLAHGLRTANVVLPMKPPQFMTHACRS